MSLPKSLVSPEVAMEVLRPVFNEVEVEHFVVVCLNANHMPIKVEVIAKGAVDSCGVDVRSVFCPAIRCLASAVIVAHNHPSGDPLPSAADFAITRRLVEAGKLLGVSVLDHFIIPTGQFAKPNDFLSMAEKGLMVS